MKKKLTISLPVNSDKCRAKAMGIAVSIAGVISVSSDADKKQLVVIGNGFDSVELMNCLTRKKIKCATIIFLEDVKPPSPPPPAAPAPQPSSPTKGECSSHCPCPPGYYNYPCVQYYPVCEPVYDSNPNCSIQ